MHIVFVKGLDDYDDLEHFLEEDDEIQFFARNDEVTLEYDDNVILAFVSDFDGFVTQVEDVGEFVRNTTIVHIIDNDGKNKAYILY